MTDTKGVRDAKEKVTEAKENIQIASLQKEISGLNDIIDDLDKKIEESNKYYDSLIEQAEKYWDSLIEGLKNYNSRWQELAKIEEQAKMEIALQKLGITTNDVLNMSESAFNAFKGNYLGILQEMYAGNDDMIGMLQKFGGISTDTLTPLSGTLNNVADSLDKYANSTLAANANTSETSEKVSSLNANTEELDQNLAKVSETLGESDGDGAIGKFGEFSDVIADAESHVTGIIDGMNNLDGMTAECTIKVNIETNSDIPAFADGTLGDTNFESGEYNVKYGKAYAEGTGKYKGLPKAEKNALVSEYGQTEMTVLPNGNTIITDEPTMMDLPKDTVIYNEEQTKKIIDNKVDVSGNAHANGTDDEGWITLSNGHRARPLREGDRGWDLIQKAQPFVDKILKGEIDIATNAMIEHQKQMEQIVRNITTTNVITNNKPSVSIGDIHVTCPGVTEQQVAEKLGGVIEKELDKQFSGFRNYADQYSRIR